MVADSYYHEYIPTGALRLVKKVFGTELQEEFAVYYQPMNPYGKRTTKISCYRWEKKRFNGVVWQSPRTVSNDSKGGE